MRYCPVSSVTPDRTFSMSAGLAASTVTPGSTPPDASRTVPVRDAWAKTVAGRSRTTSIVRHLSAVRIQSVFPSVVGKRMRRGPRQPPATFPYTRSGYLHAEGGSRYAPIEENVKESTHADHLTCRPGGSTCMQKRVTCGTDPKRRTSHAANFPRFQRERPRRGRVVQNVGWAR